MTDEDRPVEEREREAPVALSTYHTDAHLTARESEHKKQAHAESQEGDGEGGE